MINFSQPLEFRHLRYSVGIILHVQVHEKIAAHGEPKQNPVPSLLAW